MKIFMGWIIQVISWIAWSWPKKLHWWGACFLAWLWFDVIRFRRYTILRGISIAFPNLSFEERRDLARKSLRHQCYILAELFSLPQVGPKTVSQFEFHGFENYEQAHAQGRGVLMLAMHIGNGDLGVSLMALKGIQLNLITRKAKSKFFNDLWFSIRQRHGVKFIDAQGVRSAHEILAAAKRKESVIFVIDQFMTSPVALEVPFFGKKTGTGVSLAKFASKLQAPVLPVWTYRDENLKTHVVFEPVVNEGEGSGKSDEELARRTLQYNHVLEEIIRKKPEQWMWVHRRWKKFR